MTQTKECERWLAPALAVYPGAERQTGLHPPLGETFPLLEDLQTPPRLSLPLCVAVVYPEVAPVGEQRSPPEAGWGGRGGVCVGARGGAANSACCSPTVRPFSKARWCVSFAGGGGRNHSWLLSEEPSGCSDPAGLRERQKATLSHSDKWTSSIDCKVYWWGVCVCVGGLSTKAALSIPYRGRTLLA